jgi:hypothetical protein
MRRPVGPAQKGSPKKSAGVAEVGKLIGPQFGSGFQRQTLV